MRFFSIYLVFFVPSSFGIVKLTGTVYCTRTGFPLCMPGFQFGIDLITRTASLSKDGSPPDLTTSTSEIEPSLLTTNCAITLPWIPCS